MTLDELITALEAEDPARVVKYGFLYPHSYRGYYEQLAFQPAPDVTVGEMLAAAKFALGETFQGYKGGDFTMKGYTEVWLAYPGEASEESIGPTLLALMLGREIEGYGNGR